MLNVEGLRNKIIDDCTMRSKVLKNQYMKSYEAFRGVERKKREIAQKKITKESDLNRALLNYLKDDSSDNSEKCLNGFTATEIISHLLKFDVD